MIDDVKTMAELIDRLWLGAEHEPAPDRDGFQERNDLPELASALKQTGRIFHRGRDGAPAVYEAIDGPEGTPALVRRVAFLSRMVRSDEGSRISADAAEARDHGARVGSEVRAPQS